MSIVQTAGAACEERERRREVSASLAEEGARTSPTHHDEVERAEAERRAESRDVVKAGLCNAGEDEAEGEEVSQAARG